MYPQAESTLLSVRRAQYETHDVTTLVTEPAGGGKAPAFAPGQYCMLTAAGSGEIPISISGDPARADQLVFTVRASGAASSLLARQGPGDTIRMRGPFGNSWPLQEAVKSDLLLIGGGMGLAALRPVIYAAAQDRPSFGRVFVLCGARTPGDLIYTRELAAWSRLSRTEVHAIVEMGGPGWNGGLGRVTRFFDQIQLRPENTVAMTCGPEPMMRSVAAELLARGFEDDRVFLSMPTLREDGPIYAYGDVCAFDASGQRKASWTLAQALAPPLPSFPQNAGSCGLVPHSIQRFQFDR